MNEIRLNIPENRNYEYGLNQACQITSEKLASADIGEVCRKSGAKQDGNSIALNYVNTTYRIALPDAKVTAGNGGKLPLREKILILHYLDTAKGTPLSNKLITFKELPEGTSYFRTYNQRTLKPLAGFFGKEQAKLIEIAAGLGGRKAELGDASITINAFPKVPITFVLWKGDNEFPPEANILFDSTITDYLPVEDIIVLCETITWRLVKSLR